jgi:Lrp/AsnC family transcriptional regulator, leucine-responsive regulatory protein
MGPTMDSGSPPAFDRIDRKILETLQGNARISNVELAQAVGLSAAPCLRRVQALEQSGVIEGYVGLVNMRKVMLGVEAFINVQLQGQGKNVMDPVEAAIRRFPEVLECYVMTGDWDYLLHVVAQDMDEIQSFLQDNLSQIPGVMRIKTSFAVRRVVKTTALPLDHLGTK